MYELICKCGRTELVSEPKGFTFSFDDINKIKMSYVCSTCNKKMFKIRFIYERVGKLHGDHSE